MKHGLFVAVSLLATPAAAQSPLSSVTTGGGSFTNKSQSEALSLSLALHATAASGCLKGTRFLVLEWTDFSSKCAYFEAANIAETAASLSETQEDRDYFYARANELRAKGNGL